MINRVRTPEEEVIASMMEAEFEPDMREDEWEAEITIQGRFIRLDTLETVRPEIVLWGAKTSTVQVRRPALFKVEAPGRVPYMPISAVLAVRIVPASPLDARAARIAYLAARDGNQCFYCDRSLDLPKCEVEHIVATSAGGPDHASNLCLTCKECNAAAGHLSAAEKMQLAIRFRTGTHSQKKG